MILITRPLSVALGTKKKLESIGYEARIFSLLEIEYLSPVTNIDANYILITSTNAIHALGPLIGFGKNKKILAIGRKTAKACELLGFNIHTVFENSYELLNDIDKTISKEKKILYLSSNHISSNLDIALRDKGFEVERVICYKSNAVSALPSNWVAGINIVMFYSPRTAEVFAQLNKENIKHITAVCISYNTAEKIKYSGFKKVITAKRPNEEMMIEALKYAE